MRVSSASSTSIAVSKNQTSSVGKQWLRRRRASSAAPLCMSTSATPDIGTSASVGADSTATIAAVTAPVGSDSDEETYLEAATHVSRFQESRWGKEEVSEVLLQAMRIQWSYGYPQTPRGYPRLTHGFHEYPAGMQAAAADRIMDVLPGDSVLDPFMAGWEASAPGGLFLRGANTLRIL